MRKKIIYIDEDARYGGPQHRMILVAKNLKKFFDITFLISNDGNKIFKKKLKENKLYFKEIKITRLTKDFNTLLNYIVFFIPELVSLLIYLNKVKPDIVQVNSTPHFKALIAASILKIPTIWVLEDSNLPLIIKLIFKILNKIFRPNLLVTSNIVRDYYLNKKKFSNNLRKIYAPVSLKVFNPQKYKIKKFNIKKIDILMIANLTKIKGIEVFLKIVEIAPKNFYFTLCGGYTQNQKKYAKTLMLKFKKFNQKKLNYIGHQDNISNIISKCDFLICTSLSEAGPMTSMEGICMKKPLITNKVGIVNDLFKNYKKFMVVENNNPTKFINNIKKLSLVPKLRKKIIKKSHEIAVKEFSLEKISKQYQNYYNFIIKN